MGFLEYFFCVGSLSKLKKSNMTEVYFVDGIASVFIADPLMYLSNRVYWMRLKMLKGL